MLELKDVTASYGHVFALDDISLTVNKGEIVTLIGPNGAGKSTALKVICGLLEPQKGDVIFEGEIINGLKPHQLVKKGVCLVPEGRRLFTSMTVFENLEVGAYARADNKATRISVDRVHSLFPILKERHKQKAGTLSGGEQQMLAIGRALMLKPKLLLLDEPSLGLSPNYVDTVFEKIKEINSEGTTVLLVEQNAMMSLEYADRGYVFQNGKIAFKDEAKSLLENNEVKKSFLAQF